MARDLLRPSTAFSLDGLRQKQPAIKLRRHLAFVGSLPSIVPGHEGVQVAHLRYADDLIGKRSAGKGMKPSDFWVVPLAADQHRRQHDMAEREFWAEVGINPLLIAPLLFVYSQTDDWQAAQIVIRNAREISRGRL